MAFGREIFRLDSSFCFTSVQANKDYAAKLHTDRNNFGKSFIIGCRGLKSAFGGARELDFAFEIH